MNAWQTNAQTIARYVHDNMVSRCDVWGGYLDWTDPAGIAQRVITLPRKRYRGIVQLIPSTIANHFLNPKPGNGSIIGLHPASADNTCRFFGIDIDRHSEEDETPISVYHNAAFHWARVLRMAGFSVLVEDSNGAGGVHIWVLLDKPVSARWVYAFVQSVIADHAQVGISEPPETYPKQADIGAGFGNWLRLPGRHHKRDHWSRFHDCNQWLSIEDSVKLMLATEPRGADLIPEPPKPEPTTTRKTLTAHSEWYRGQACDVQVTTTCYGSIGLEIVFKLNERSDAGVWVSCNPFTAEGTYWIIAKNGDNHTKIVQMLADSLGITQALAERALCGDPSTDGWRPAQVKVDTQGNASWLRSFDAKTAIEKYLAALPTSLIAGQNRSKHAYRFAAFLQHDRGLTEAETMPWLQRWNERNAEPLADSKLITTIKNAVTYGGRVSV